MGPKPSPRFSRCFAWTTFCATLWISSPCFADDHDRPPPLTFDKHVDYLAWYDEFAGKREGNNALEIYQELMVEGKPVIHVPSGDEAARQFDVAMTKPWKKEDFPILKTCLDKNKSALKKFENATERPRYWQPRDPTIQSLLEVKLPSLSLFRSACRALIVQGWMQGADQAETLLTNWRIILGNARHNRQQPFLISQLASSASECFVYQQACAAANCGIIKGKQITRAMTVLHDYNPATETLTDPVLLEWACTLDTLQSICSDSRIDQAKWTDLYQSFPTKMKNEKGPAFDPIKTRDYIEEYFTKWDAAVAGPFTAVRMRKLKELREAERPAIRKNPFLHLMLTDLARYYELNLRTEIHRRGTMLVLAIHQHGENYGKWPGKLDELTVDDLKILRGDPYADVDFAYKLIKGNPLLYSIASDSKDDRGRHDPNWGEGADGGDFVFWPVQEK